MEKEDLVETDTDLEDNIIAEAESGGDKGSILLQIEDHRDRDYFFFRGGRVKGLRKILRGLWILTPLWDPLLSFPHRRPSSGCCSPSSVFLVSKKLRSSVPI